MGFFDIVKQVLDALVTSNSSTIKEYDFDSLEGISAITIPVDNRKYDKPVYYILQRKATEHKKNKNMDLAIACLRKSNEISDSMERPELMEKDYLRLVKYIEKTGNMELAKQEEDAIYQRHPEFKDKRIARKTQINAFLQQQKKWNNDLVYLKTTRVCPVCSPYSEKIYSISGKSKKYPKLPDEVLYNGGFCPQCSCSLSAHFEGINNKP